MSASRLEQRATGLLELVTHAVASKRLGCGPAIEGLHPLYVQVPDGVGIAVLNLDVARALFGVERVSVERRRVSCRPVDERVNLTRFLDLGGGEEPILVFV